MFSGGFMFKVTIVQVGRVPGRDVSGMFELARKLVSEGPVGDLVVFPENWVSAKPLGVGEFESIVGGLYEVFESNVVGGLQYVVDFDGRVRSVGLAFIEGSPVRVCEKIYPSKAVGERGRVEPGRIQGAFKVKGWTLGCVACVDIFYPEVSRVLAALGASVIYNPSSTPDNRLGLWRSALRVRASENVVYTVGVNAVGNRYPDGRVAGGSSVVFSPLGRVLASLGPNIGVSTVTLDSGRLEEALERWAFREDFERDYATLYKDYASKRWNI
ncbi:MAG: carbon-nitrogen hydrolase family protein [Thermoprotei archaeon]|nr:carbon-nitrogen hydrolase family protein [Thermoprotei archaeon]